MKGPRFDKKSAGLKLLGRFIRLLIYNKQIIT